MRFPVVVPSGAQRARRSCLITLIATVLVLAGTGCSAISTALGDEPPLTRTCGVAVDGSGSGGKEGFDADALLAEHFDRFVRDNQCAKVLFAPLSGGSEASPCSEPDTQVEEEVSGNVDVRQVRKANRGEALKAARAMLECVRTDPRSVDGSDVIGALRILADKGRAGGSDYHVLVVSDFIHRDPALYLDTTDLSTQQARDTALRRAAGRVPDFHDASVEAVGFGKLYQKKQPDRYPGFLAFWQAFMKSAHARFSHS